jgi:hypothetical protein
MQDANKINSQLALSSDRVALYYGDILDPNVQAKIPDEVADVSITDPEINLRIDTRIVLKPRD